MLFKKLGAKWRIGIIHFYFIFQSINTPLQFVLVYSTNYTNKAPSLPVGANSSPGVTYPVFTNYISWRLVWQKSLNMLCDNVRITVVSTFPASNGASQILLMYLHRSDSRDTEPHISPWFSPELQQWNAFRAVLITKICKDAPTHTRSCYRITD